MPSIVSLEIRVPARPKTVAQSFRITEVALEALEEEANRQNISVNTLVNQILLGYAEWGRYVPNNSIRLTRKTFEEILKPIPEDAMSKAGAAAGKSAPAALMTSKWGLVNTGIVLDFIKALSGYANLFEYYEKQDGGRWTVTLVHELGPKWSAFISQYLMGAFSAGGVGAKIKTSDRAVIFSIEPSKTIMVSQESV